MYWTWFHYLLVTEFDGDIVSSRFRLQAQVVCSLAPGTQVFIMLVTQVFIIQGICYKCVYAMVVTLDFPSMSKGTRIFNCKDTICTCHWNLILHTCKTVWISPSYGFILRKSIVFIQGVKFENWIRVCYVYIWLCWIGNLLVFTI